jgi:sarcosine oxidase/L-pipecolate oxidase
VLSDGRTIEGDLLIVAAGSWTPSLLPKLDAPIMTPSGQTIAPIQLTEEEARQYKDMPLRALWLPCHGHLKCLRRSSLISRRSSVRTRRSQLVSSPALTLRRADMFPPTADHVMKVSIHAPGITHRNPQTGRSEPITRHHHLAAATEASASALEASHGNVTAEAAAAVRSCLEHVIPGLAKRTFDSTRLCWCASWPPAAVTSESMGPRRYNDTIDSNFMVDYHPTRPKIVLHTGGSGHAFKVRRLTVPSVQHEDVAHSSFPSSAIFSSSVSRASYLRSKPTPSRRRGSERPSIVAILLDERR